MWHPSHPLSLYLPLWIPSVCNIVLSCPSSGRTESGVLLSMGTSDAVVLALLRFQIYVQKYIILA